MIRTATSSKPTRAKVKTKAKPRRKGSKRDSKPVIGWREWVALPQLGVETIKAKIDTGARTSALHAWNIVPFDKDGEIWVRFFLHPIQRNNKHAIACEAPVIDRRAVRNTGGKAERRYVIRTGVTLGNISWPIEVTLTNRDKMGFRLLLGRSAVKNRFLINAGRSYLGAKTLVE